MAQGENECTKLLCVIFSTFGGGGKKCNTELKLRRRVEKDQTLEKEAKPNKVERPPLLSSPAIAAGGEETKREKKLFFSVGGLG